MKSNYSAFFAKAHILSRLVSSRNSKTAAYQRSMRNLASQASELDVDSRYNLIRAIRMQVAARNREHLNRLLAL